MLKLSVVLIMFFMVYTQLAYGFPTNNEDYRFIERDYSSPGAHQLASWLTFQLRPKEIVPPIEMPIIPYRLHLPANKRNSEVTNAMMSSEESQKMYREGRK